MTSEKKKALRFGKINEECRIKNAELKQIV